MSRDAAPTRSAAADRLRDIESVTHAGLAHLSFDELLTELLDRVLAALGANTSVVLLLDEPTGQLVATAARGIEEEVHQGARVPLGKGFAGRVALTRQPVAIEDIDEAEIVNPVLRGKGLRSLLGVPLIAGGQLLGVLHVGTVDRRRFTEDDVDLLRMVADRMALATQAHRSESERAAAVILQRSLLPERMPQVPGLESAIRYIAGGEGEVGGDWYDMFVLPSGAVAITIGDVAGKGLRAAVVMSRLRSAVRAYALEPRVDPGGILDKVDRMLTHFQPGEMATALLGVLEPSFQRLHLSVAGHPAPVIAPRDEQGRYLDIAVDPPLGVGLLRHRRTTVVDVGPGALVCFYTDGLVERRGVPLDKRIEELCDAVTADSPEQVCATIMNRLIGLDRPTDDVAVLAVRRLNLGVTAPVELAFPAVPSSLAEIRAAANRWLHEAGATPADVIDLLLAVGEATSNVVEHAYGPDPGSLQLRLELHERDVVMTIRDDGNWRLPRGANRGRGTQIMRSTTDEMRIERSQGGTRVVLRRRLGQAPRR